MEKYETVHLPQSIMREVDVRRGIAKRSTYVRALLQRAWEAGITAEPAKLPIAQVAT